MIFVDGVPFSTSQSQVDPYSVFFKLYQKKESIDLLRLSSFQMVRGREILAALLDHPVVLSSSDHLKGTPEKKVSSAERPPLGRLVYVFQREYATVDPALVQVDTSSNSIMPASFDRSSRGPDEIVRRIRVSLSSDDSNWKGRMSDWKYYASSLQQLSDSEFLLRCSTSPYAEAPDFVESERRFVFNDLL
ncbi:hypothetical protein B296_00033845 [Ensete ventricosum]|uniref:Uncharacterized protein n=1 Tax=Ensete ventricosum TaxID=4639 RepID=A0A426XJZ0_ENSVE|nr:hypothetical protein B296_00033845 [Ensete ventricosum]